MALPVTTVNTVKEAQALQTLCCAAAYDGKRFIINASSGFIRANVDSMFAAGEYLEKKYAEMQALETKYKRKRK